MSDIIREVKSGYTPGARPNRGYHASEVIVSFKEGSSEEEQLAVMQEIRAEKAKSNMWAYAPKKIGENVWRISYGFDSGD